MRANFTQCSLEYQANTTRGAELRAQWGWHGDIVGILRNPNTQISRAGCLALCGEGANYYPWDDVSSTITTWLLPVVGTLLQAPFESNAFKRTLLAICRWVGSPIASLSYILWNIKVSAKAALMVDMAVKYDRGYGRTEKADFGSMRDSMYLLLVMNQYTMRQAPVFRTKEAEALLRIVLFSKDLKLIDTDKSLRQMRRILARELREMRRRGVVPVFVSIMWFLFAFALSIQAAFGNLGQNTTAHDLALGCLLAWFPILIMGSIVDRNPIAADAIRKKLNALVDHVSYALADETHRNDFIDSFSDQSQFETFKERVLKVAQKAPYMHDFFVDFAGQARIRWHYGAAHPILSDIEDCYIAKRGRNWLANESEARTNLVLGSVNQEGLVWFDVREFWQVASAIIIVGGSCGGAFILSFFTPTVGLGCRSGGYTIFFTISLGLLIIEMSVWLALSAYQINQAPLVDRTRERLHSNATFNHWEEESQEKWGHIKEKISRFFRNVENFFGQCIVRLVLCYPWEDKEDIQGRVEGFLRTSRQRLKDLETARKWEYFFFRPIEIFNAIWLVYIVLAQTMGIYKTCYCVTSTWGGAGGYLDFSVQDTSNSPWVSYYWTAGTVLTSLVMGLSMFYITVEWCQQSFLSTEKYSDAMNGLRLTRQYRSYTFPLRLLFRLLLKHTLDPLETLALSIGLVKRTQATLLWTKNHTWDPLSPQLPLPSSPTNPHPNHQHHHHHHTTTPSIELTDYSSTPMHRDDSQTSQTKDTPAMAHSLFPPPRYRPRPRSLSDSSLPAAHFHDTPARHSTDSSLAPLVQRPSATHWRERADSSAEEEGRWSGEEGVGSPTFLLGEHSVFMPLLGVWGGGGG